MVSSLFGLFRTCLTVDNHQFSPAEKSSFAFVLELVYRIQNKTCLEATFSQQDYLDTEGSHLSVIFADVTIDHDDGALTTATCVA